MGSEAKRSVGYSVKEPRHGFFEPIDISLCFTVCLQSRSIHQTADCTFSLIVAQCT